jgi:hypothetical protein
VAQEEVNGMWREMGVSLEGMREVRALDLHFI